MKKWKIGFLAIACSLSLLACDKSKEQKAATEGAAAQSPKEASKAEAQKVAAKAAQKASAEKRERSILGGVWAGFFEGDGYEGIFWGVIDERGHAAFMTENDKMIYGHLQAEKDGTFLGRLNIFIDGRLDGEIEISGMAKSQHSLKGKHQRVGNDKAKSYGFEMNYDETYEKKASLKDFAGKWEGERGTLIVDEKGKVTGTRKGSDSCKLSGAFTTIDDRFAVYSLILKAKDCPGPKESNGMIALGMTAKKDDTLLYAVVHGEVARTSSMHRSEP